MQWSSIQITSSRLTMRPFAARDADEAFECITSTLTRYMAFEPAPSKAAFESIWREWLPKIAAGVDFTFTIRLREGTGFIGLAGLHRATDTEPELGIWVRENEHGHQYGREAVMAIAKWGAKTFRPQAFIYPVAEANLPSRRIAEDLGGCITAYQTLQKYSQVIYRIPANPWLSAEAGSDPSVIT